MHNADKYMCSQKSQAFSNQFRNKKCGGKDTNELYQEDPGILPPRIKSTWQFMTNLLAVLEESVLSEPKQNNQKQNKTKLVFSAKRYLIISRD